MKQSFIKKMLPTLFMTFATNIAFAYDFEVDGIYYDVISTADLTCEVVSGDDKYEGEITIPKGVNFRNRELSVTRIGNSAFQDCGALSKIELPNTVTMIGNYAFKGCSSLATIRLSNSVTKIGNFAFHGCSSLAIIKLPNSITMIGDYAFFGCSSLATIKLPNSITKIGSHVFEYCSSLTSVSLSENLDEIDIYAFSKCKSINEVDLGGIKRIPYGLFKDCPLLNNISIPGTVDEIELYLMNGFFFQDYTFVYDKLDYLEFHYSNKSLKLGYCYDAPGLSSERWAFRSGWTYESSYNGVYFGSNDMLKADNIKELYVDRRLDRQLWFTKIKKLTLGKKLTHFNAINLSANEELDTIICMSIVPPSFAGCSNKQYMDIVVKVPLEALEAYKQADSWKGFWNLEGDPSLNSSTTGVEDISTDIVEKVEVGRYDINGRRVSDSHTGIMIIRYSDGSTRKVIKLN